jgi:hypothetical protein
MFKTCATCKEEKPLSDYRRDSKRKEGVQSSCKPCMRQYHKNAYTTKYGEAAKIRTKQRFLKAKQWIDEYKASRSCEVCSESELVCLDLHHKDPKEKEFHISGNQNRSLTKIQEEVKKCMVVCRNCHAKIHAGLIGEVPEPGLMEQS